MPLDFPAKQIQGPTSHNGGKAKVCQRYCFDICCVAQHSEDTPRPRCSKMTYQS